MAAKRPQGRVVFRTGIHLFIIIGIFASLFLGLGIAIAIKKGDWTFLGVAGGATAVLFSLLGYLKLEIREDGLSYRNLSTNRSIDFVDIA